MKGRHKMISAMFRDGRIISINEYNDDLHSQQIYCIDKSCKAPLVHVKGNERTTPYFKTTGKNESKHTSSCGFYRPLSFEESLSKINDYQSDFIDQGLSETVIKLSFNKLDPDYEPRRIQREDKDEEKKNKETIKIKNETAPPNSISSLKSIVKLFSTYEPDILSSILIQVKGHKIPISNLILSQEVAHEKLWSDMAVLNLPYLVHGEIEAINRREKVIYLNFKKINNIPFSIVIFEKYFKYFTYTDEELIGKYILCWGHLHKNTFNDKSFTNLLIKSDEYIEIIKKG